MSFLACPVVLLEETKECGGQSCSVNDKLTIFNYYFVFLKLCKLQNKAKTK